MTSVTCACAVIHNGNILLAHPTNGRHVAGWSIPKGIADPGEDPRVAALRELWEETGVDFRGREAQLIDLGRHKYRPGKDYHMFRLDVNEPVDHTACVCESYFIHNEQQYPEVDAFMWVSIEDAALVPWLNIHQAALVRQLILNK